MSKDKKMLGLHNVPETPLHHPGHNDFKDTFRWKMLKHHYPLIPLYGATIVGCVFAAWYTWRLTYYCPDSWVKKNRDPWMSTDQKYQYKFFSPTVDYKNQRFSPNRPNIEQMCEEEYRKK
ncbi:hypothetical protein LOTGIDRAFT_232408 [Lottia gigantea]|uniref:Uncharacterized protein n=1 Tax=Lottia gigantea TaxID=225164 RepID=V4BYC8_LOTGI|nr:hypothetical protein LOTGIDRAFT_232408 [Lottia gigantea]ESO94134.1 hypothetical protein LOTGIDRAFT_232408 [Lottia gigantea]